MLRRGLGPGQEGLHQDRRVPAQARRRRRLRYLLTPTAMVEKTRLTHEYMAYSLSLYRRARQTLRLDLSQLAERGVKRIALYGTGAAAAVAYLTLRQLGLEAARVFAPESGGRAEPALAELLRLGLAHERIVTLRQPAPPQKIAP